MSFLLSSLPIRIIPDLQGPKENQPFLNAPSSPFTPASNFTPKGGHSWCVIIHAGLFLPNCTSVPLPPWLSHVAQPILTLPPTHSLPPTPFRCPTDVLPKLPCGYLSKRKFPENKGFVCAALTIAPRRLKKIVGKVDGTGICCNCGLKQTRLLLTHLNGGSAWGTDVLSKLVPCMFLSSQTRIKLAWVRGQANLILVCEVTPPPSFVPRPMLGRWRFP